MSKLLVIDDDRSLREMMDMMLRNAGHQVVLAADGLQGLKAALTEQFDVIISDIKMPGLSGVEVLKGLRSEGNQTPVILVSAFATPATAVEAIQEEAFDFIPKPFNPRDLLGVIDAALAHHSVEQEGVALTELVSSSQRFGRMVGVSPVMSTVYDLVKRAAQTSTSILITGESGTGKELVARAVHENSERAEHEFVAINCGGIPENLLESELFGHKKGAFTGATADKRGLVALADGGTLFLDELADLSMPMQVKLLRVIQEKTFRPVGGGLEDKSDVRFISATNKSLENEIIAGRFREDLYYRLNVINIQLPPLRDRPDDIPLLAHFFLEKYSKALGKNLKKLSAYALDILSHYSFPGNVRELENIIERSVALEQSNIILPESLRLAEFKRPGMENQFPKSTFSANWPGGFTTPLGAAHPTIRGVQNVISEQSSLLADLPLGGIDKLLANVELYYLIRAMTSTDGVRGQAAALLGISPWRMRSHLVVHGLSGLSKIKLASLNAHDYPKPNLPGGLASDWDENGLNLNEIMIAIEKHFIVKALEASGGNKTEAASLLNLTRRSFQHRLERTGG